MGSPVPGAKKVKKMTFLKKELCLGKTARQNPIFTPPQVLHSIGVLFYTKTCNISKKLAHRLLNSSVFLDFYDFLEHSCSSYANVFLCVIILIVLLFALSDTVCTLVCFFRINSHCFKINHWCYVCVHNIIQLFISLLICLYAAFLSMSILLNFLRSVSVHGLAIFGPAPGL